SKESADYTDLTDSSVTLSRCHAASEPRAGNHRFHRWHRFLGIALHSRSRLLTRRFASGVTNGTIQRGQRDDRESICVIGNLWLQPFSVFAAWRRGSVTPRPKESVRIGEIRGFFQSVHSATGIDSSM